MADEEATHRRRLAERAEATAQERVRRRARLEEAQAVAA